MSEELTDQLEEGEIVDDEICRGNEQFRPLKLTEPIKINLKKKTIKLKNLAIPRKNKVVDKKTKKRKKSANIIDDVTDPLRTKKSSRKKCVESEDLTAGQAPKTAAANKQQICKDLSKRKNSKEIQSENAQIKPPKASMKPQVAIRPSKLNITAKTRTKNKITNKSPVPIRKKPLKVGKSVKNPAEEKFTVPSQDKAAENNTKISPNIDKQDSEESQGPIIPSNSKVKNSSQDLTVNINISLPMGTKRTTEAKVTKSPPNVKAKKPGRAKTLNVNINFPNICTKSTKQSRTTSSDPKVKKTVEKHSQNVNINLDIPIMKIARKRPQVISTDLHNGSCIKRPNLSSMHQSAKRAVNMVDKTVKDSPNYSKQDVINSGGICPDVIEASDGNHNGATERQTVVVHNYYIYPPNYHSEIERLQLSLRDSNIPFSRPFGIEEQSYSSTLSAPKLSAEKPNRSTFQPFAANSTILPQTQNPPITLFGQNCAQSNSRTSKPLRYHPHSQIGKYAEAIKKYSLSNTDEKRLSAPKIPAKPSNVDNSDWQIIRSADDSNEKGSSSVILKERMLVGDKNRDAALSHNPKIFIRNKVDGRSFPYCTRDPRILKETQSAFPKDI